MNRDDARELLGENATEEQITKLLNKFHAKDSEKVKNLEKQVQDITAEKNRYSDYDEIKRQLDEINKANMTEQERLEAQKKEIEANLKSSKLIVNTAKAKEILAGENIQDELISSLVSDNMDETVARVNMFKNTLTSIKDTVAKQTKESLVTADLKPSIPSANPNEDIMTIDKFMDLSSEEQEKFINENPTAFENL